MIVYSVESIYEYEYLPQNTSVDLYFSLEQAATAASELVKEFLELRGLTVPIQFIYDRLIQENKYVLTEDDTSNQDAVSFFIRKHTVENQNQFLDQKKESDIKKIESSHGTFYFDGKYLYDQLMRFRLSWVDLSEGYDGSYNSNDEEDCALLRFDYEYKEDGNWQYYDSYCTNFIHLQTEDQSFHDLLLKGLIFIADRINDSGFESDNGFDISKRVLEEMSYIKHDWTNEIKIHSPQNTRVEIR